MLELSLALLAIGVALVAAACLFYRRPGIGIGQAAVYAFSPEADPGTRLRSPGTTIHTTGLVAVAGAAVVGVLIASAENHARYGVSPGPVTWLADAALVVLIVGPAVLSGVLRHEYGYRLSVAMTVNAVVGGVPALAATVLLRDSYLCWPFLFLTGFYLIWAAVTVPVAVGTGRGVGRAPARWLAAVALIGVLSVGVLVAVLSEAAARPGSVNWTLVWVGWLILLAGSVPATATTGALLAIRACRSSSGLCARDRVAVASVGALGLFPTAGLAALLAWL